MQKKDFFAEDLFADKARVALRALSRDRNSDFTVIGDFADCGRRPRTSPLDSSELQVFRALRSATKGSALGSCNFLKKIE